MCYWRVSNWERLVVVLDGSWQVRRLLEGEVEDERGVFRLDWRREHLDFWTDALLLAFPTSLVLH